MPDVAAVAKAVDSGHGIDPRVIAEEAGIALVVAGAKEVGRPAESDEAREMTPLWFVVMTEVPP